MFNMQQIGKKIVTLRKAKNMTQTELADTMGVSFQAVSNWERGNSMPDVSKLPQLAALFDCSVDELLDEKSELLHSVMKDELQEYVENHDISREEMEATVPILKPDHMEQIANSMLLKNERNIDIFYPYLDKDTLRELAEQKIKKGESIEGMLLYLEEESLLEFAMQQYEQGKNVDAYYPYLKKNTLRELAERKIEKGESIEGMLLYLEEESLLEFAIQQCEQGKNVDAYYPYLKKDTLRELAERKIKKGESIEDMLPYLDRNFLKTIVLNLY